MFREHLTNLFNGPVIAGVGAFSDTSLPQSKWHYIPVTSITLEKQRFKIDGIQKAVSIIEETERPLNDLTVESTFNVAMYNVQEILRYDDQQPTVVDIEFRQKLRNIVVGVLMLMAAENMYIQEMRPATQIQLNYQSDATTLADVQSPDNNQEAITLIVCRCHTKYQTNHSMGTNVFAASMASMVASTFGLRSTRNGRSDLNSVDKAKYELLYTTLHWALHPVNECFLIPQFLVRTGITKFDSVRELPKPRIQGFSYYFTLRENTPPSGTHHLFLCQAAYNAIKPYGLLKYYPDTAQIYSLAAQFQEMQLNRARYHQAATYWDLKHVNVNQKNFDVLLFDLGYAVAKILPRHTLNDSPILANISNPTPSWQGIVNYLASRLDAVTQRALSDENVSDLSQHFQITANVSTEFQKAEQLIMMADRLDVEAESDESETSDIEAQPSHTATIGPSNNNNNNDDDNNNEGPNAPDDPNEHTETQSSNAQTHQPSKVAEAEPQSSNQPLTQAQIYAKFRPENFFDAEITETTSKKRKNQIQEATALLRRQRYVRRNTQAVLPGRVQSGLERGTLDKADVVPILKNTGLESIIPEIPFLNEES